MQVPREDAHSQAARAIVQQQGMLLDADTPAAARPPAWPPSCAASPRRPRLAAGSLAQGPASRAAPPAALCRRAALPPEPVRPILLTHLTVSVSAINSQDCAVLLHLTMLTGGSSRHPRALPIACRFSWCVAFEDESLCWLQQAFHSPGSSRQFSSAPKRWVSYVPRALRHAWGCCEKQGAQARALA